MKKFFLFKHLKKLGLKSGDSALVYSNLSSFGSLDKNLTKKILNYLINFLGKKGTLFMPSYTFDHPKNFIFKINKLQENYSTGSLVKYFFKNKNIKRSFRLIHSHIGIGKYSDLLTKTNNMNSFGKNSDFDLMTKKNFKCVFLGCMPSQAATYFFHLECLNNVPYRKKIFLEKKYYKNRISKKIKIDYFSNNKKKKYNLDKSFMSLKKEGAQIKEIDLKFGKSFCIDLKEFHKYGNRLFKKDINFLIK